MVAKSTTDLSQRQPLGKVESTAVLTPGEAAGFIADMALDLRNIASRARLGLLTQLLEMVITEALSLSNDRPQRVKKPDARHGDG